MHFNRNLANILAVGGTLEQIYRRWQYFDITTTPYGSQLGKNTPGTVTQDRVKAYAEFGWFTGSVAMRLAELYGGRASNTTRNTTPPSLTATAS